MQPDIIKLRVFGSKSCEECEKQIKAFDIHAIEYEFIDADDLSKEQICDTYSVDRLPHIHAYLSSTGKVVATSVGYVSPTVFMIKLGKALEELRSPTNMEIKGVRQGPPRTIETKQDRGGCKGCKNGKKAD